MKFRIGQKVRCIRQPSHYNENDRMLFVGRTYTIKDISQDTYIRLEELPRKHNYNENRFEPVEENILPEDLFKI